MAINPILAGLNTASTNYSNRLVNEQRRAATSAINFQNISDNNNATYNANLVQMRDLDIAMDDDPTRIDPVKIGNGIRNNDQGIIGFAVNQANQNDPFIKENEGFSALGLTKGPISDGEQTYALAGEYEKEGALGRIVRFITRDRTTDENEPVEFGTAGQIGEKIALFHNQLSYKPGVAAKQLAVGANIDINNTNIKIDDAKEQMLSVITTAYDMIGNEKGVDAITSLLAGESDPFKQIEILQKAVKELSTVESDDEQAIIDPQTATQAISIGDAAKNNQTSISKDDPTTLPNEGDIATEKPLDTSKALTLDNIDYGTVYSDAEFDQFLGTPLADGIQRKMRKKYKAQARRITALRKELDAAKQDGKLYGESQAFNQIEKLVNSNKQLIADQIGRAERGEQRDRDRQFTSIPFLGTYNSPTIKNLYKDLADSSNSSARKAEIEAEIEKYAESKNIEGGKAQIDFVRNNSMDRKDFKNPDDFSLTPAGRAPNPERQADSAAIRDADGNTPSIVNDAGNIVPNPAYKGPTDANRAAEAGSTVGVLDRVSDEVKKDPKKAPIVTQQERQQIEDYLKSQNIQTIKDAVDKLSDEKAQGLRALLASYATTDAQKNAIYKEFSNYMQTGDTGFSAKEAAAAGIDARNAATAVSNSQRQWKQLNFDMETKRAGEYGDLFGKIDPILKNIQSAIYDINDDDQTAELRGKDDIQRLAFGAGPNNIHSLASRTRAQIAAARNAKDQDVRNTAIGKANILRDQLNASLSGVIQAYAKDEKWFNDADFVGGGDFDLSRIKISGRDGKGQPNEISITQGDSELSAGKISLADLATYMGGSNTATYKYFIAELNRREKGE